MYLRRTDYGPVTCYELARPRLGKVLWTTRLYFADRVMIDTGAPNMEAAVAKLAERHRPEAVLLTHHHEDHSGNAMMIAGKFGVPVLASPATVRAFGAPFHLAPFQRLVWGSPRTGAVQPMEETITVGNLTFRAVSAPGHSPDMTVLLEPHRGWLFSGDLYLASRIKFFREDEDFAQTKTSLTRVAGLDFDALFCGHNPKPRDGRRFLEEKREYLEELEAAVRDLARRGLSSREITGRVLGGEGWYPFLTSGRMAKQHLVESILASGESEGR